MTTQRKTKRKVLEAGVLLFFIIAIIGFTSSWKAGLLWLLADVFLFSIWSSYWKKSDIAPHINRTSKVFLLLVFVGLFGWGGTFFSGSLTYANFRTPKRLLAENRKKTDTMFIKNFENEWAIKKVQGFNDEYIVDYKLSKKLDTIYFQLDKEATKGDWKLKAFPKQVAFQKQIDSIMRSDYGKEFSIIKPKVIIIPDAEQEEINIADYKHYKAVSRQSIINRQFSSRTGANIYLENYLKNNDTYSNCYEHITTNYSDKGSYIAVQTKIKTCNSFGTHITLTVIAKIDLNGNILSVE